MKRIKRIRKLMDRLVAKPGKKISLKDYDPEWTGNIKDNKDAARALLQDGVRARESPGRLWAQEPIRC